MIGMKILKKYYLYLVAFAGFAIGMSIGIVLIH